MWWCLLHGAARWSWVHDIMHVARRSTLQIQILAAALREHCHGAPRKAIPSCDYDACNLPVVPGSCSAFSRAAHTCSRSLKCRGRLFHSGVSANIREQESPL